MATFHWPGDSPQTHADDDETAAGGMLSDDDRDGSVAASFGAVPPPVVSDDVVSVPVGTSLEVACRALILATLERCGGVRKHAAELLGISLKTLYNKLVAYRRQERAAVAARETNGTGSTDSSPPPARSDF